MHVTFAHACVYACKEFQKPEFDKFLIKNMKLSKDIIENFINLLHRCNNTILTLGLQLFLKENMTSFFQESGNGFACVTVTWCVISRLMTVAEQSHILLEILNAV